MGIHFQAGIMASEILRSFEEWLDSVTDEELLAALEEVDEELAAAQRAANVEYSCKEYTNLPSRSIHVTPPSGYSTEFSNSIIEAA